MKSHLVEAELIRVDGGTDGLTDMNKQTVVFRRFTNGFKWQLGESRLKMRVWFKTGTVECDRRGGGECSERQVGYWEERMGRQSSVDIGLVK